MEVKWFHDSQVDVAQDFLNPESQIKHPNSLYHDPVLIMLFSGTPFVHFQGNVHGFCGLDGVEY